MDGTSPIIGNGIAKESQDFCVLGYSIGCTPGNPDKEPILFDYKKHHVLCYNIEAEFTRSPEPSGGASILRISMVCTCGWCRVLSVRKQSDSTLPHIVCTTNDTTPQCITLHQNTNYTTGVTMSVFTGTVMRNDGPDDEGC